MISAVNKQPDGTIELTITIPAADVKKAWDQIVEETVKNTVLPGFRKGKAPKKLAEEKLD
ncbi:trigger factor family protein, partial [Candidatus Microgenomates bacterium]|nr:trigger factor family protein [Candidatus Microgenomates bacterium]